MNKPVAWIIDAKMTDCDDNFIWNTGDYPDWQVKDWIPLYTHPVNAVNISQEYVDKTQNNRHDLTDEEIMDIGREMFESPRWPSTALDFAKAILRKAQEK